MPWKFNEDVGNYYWVEEPGAFTGAEPKKGSTYESGYREIRPVGTFPAVVPSTVAPSAEEAARQRAASGGGVIR